MKSIGKLEERHVGGVVGSKGETWNSYSLIKIKNTQIKYLKRGSRLLKQFLLLSDKEEEMWLDRSSAEMHR